MSDLKSISFPCIKIKQPLGEFYLARLTHNEICEITWVDVRRIEGERGFETYLGIQRPLKKSRVKDLSQYVLTPDACFPTGVILAVDANCASYNDNNNVMTLTEYAEDGKKLIKFDQIAKVIDGQHRIEGLRAYTGKSFDINVSIFVDMDIADQAYLFSTVNLAQTKVNKSLVYDLFDLAKSRSPQKTCHNIAVALDKNESSPFYQRIKRLGVATEGRFNETITQATFVQSLMRYISDNPEKDRAIYLKGSVPELTHGKELEKFIFRNMFIEEKDLEITDILWNYFDAIKARWPNAWNNFGRGIMLNKTNGFRGLMRFLKPSYLYLTEPGNVPDKDQFLKIFNRIEMRDDDFNTDDFKPGTGGEASLYHKFIELSEIT